MEKKLNEILQKLSESKEADFYLFSGSITQPNADKFIDLLRKHGECSKNCALILTTYGGNPDAGYRIIRAIKRRYDKLSIYVLGFCKSTGTLMALGADEIIMSDFSEFGPLDIQLAKDDELSNTSGLNYLQSLISLNEQLFRSFEDNFMNLKRKSSNTITTKTAAEISSKLSVGLISPISAQLDPIKMGEVQRAIKIAEAYGRRLTDNHELVIKLIVGYPSHGFVIDFEEAKDIFSNVRWVDENESIFEQLLFHLVRKEMENDDIINDLNKSFVNLVDKESEKNNIYLQPSVNNEIDDKNEQDGNKE